ncbi:YchJ family protein [Corynebacterium tapiri]|uniref:YchJ family protein n=1 Tax=Corynebacterium tapiri TaxID=1448266 RepID=UPI001FE790B3|nr:YchJ family metal-binding protein [Corynebacterium tapiri]
MRCPCSTGLPFDECCQRYHEGQPAPTALALMRSRFSAFAVRNEDYLLRTWAPATRPDSLDLSEFPIRFYRLDILDVVNGGLTDDTGIVEFEAFYKGAERGSQRERSRFERGSDNCWYYADGVIAD